jgi:hypothetical protein
MGLGPGWSVCPPTGDGVKVWSMNNAMNWRTDIDYIFEVHDFHNKLNRVRGGYQHQTAIREAIAHDVPYVVRERWDFLPGLKQVVYPWEAIFKEFQSDYLGCSMDCMIAMAIYCGYSDIQLYGIGINSASPYDFQVPSMNYWVGVCHGRRINIKVNTVGNYKHTDILTTKNGEVYGLRIPQRKWPTFDPTLPMCDCMKTPNARHTAFDK